MNIHRVLIWVVFLFLSVGGTINADQDAFLTRGFPKTDRAEAMSVAPGATEGPKMNLDAKETARLMAMVRGQSWIGPAGSCDKLQYVLRFYAKGKLVAARGICFHCGCFVALDSEMHPSGQAMSFDIKTARAKELEAFLAKLFPARS